MSSLDAKSKSLVLSCSGSINLIFKVIITQLNETYLKVKFGCNSIGTNSLRIMGVNIDASRDYSSDFRDI